MILSCIEFQVGIQGEDHIEELPAWIRMVEFSFKCCLTCKTEDQKTDRGPVVVEVQKEERG
jgi:hypothetical protein